MYPTLDCLRSLNRSVDMATPRAQVGNGRVPFNGSSLAPYCPPIDEAPECPPTPKTSSTPNILALTEVRVKFFGIANFSLFFPSLINTLCPVFFNTL